MFKMDRAEEDTSEIDQSCTENGHLDCVAEMVTNGNVPKKLHTTKNGTLLRHQLLDPEIPSESKSGESPPCSHVTGSENAQSDVLKDNPALHFDAETNLNEGAGSTQNEGEGEKDEQRMSPDPNCAICLGHLENKSFTDSCFHEFCFTCLLEWSKVKAECPLCKQAFKSIIHNVRSIEDYDQYYITVRNSGRYPFRNGSDRRFRYSTTMTSERLRHLAFERSLDFQNYRLAFAPHMYHGGNFGFSSPTSSGSDYRRRVYDSNMWVSEETEYPRYRESNPEFFRQNPACTHRLIPWLNRELLALLQSSENQVSFVMELILALIMRFEITSSEFHEHVYPYLQTRTEHFIHEFSQFARSPFEMDVYDRNAVYRHGESNPLSTASVPIHGAADGNSIPVIELDDDNEPDDLSSTMYIPKKHRYSTRQSQNRHFSRWYPSQLRRPRPTRIGLSDRDPLETEFVSLDMPSTSRQEIPQVEVNVSVGMNSDEDDCMIVDFVNGGNPSADPPAVIDIMSSSDDESEAKTERIPEELELERSSRKNRCTFHYDYSSDSCSETNESSTNNSIESARNIKKLKIKSFIGNIVRNISMPSTSEQSSSPSQSGHRKHKKSKKHKHKHHRHRHHSKHE